MKNNGHNNNGGAGLTRPRRLLLCLDGVPHEVINAAKQRGLFDSFGAPSCLLSPFPTMTNVALSAMLGATAPLGYESLYFDKQERELRGGVRKYMNWRRTPDNKPSSYMDELDYQEPLPFEFLVYVAPEAVWRADMRRFHERFRNAPQHRDFFAFLKGTDGLLHIRGPERLSVALESLDKILRQIQAACGNETEIVLFSDHGMNLQENRRVHMQTHLTRRGFRFSESLRRKERRGVSVPAFGLCGYAALYCADEDRANVADALVDLEGLDFALHQDGPEVVAVKSGLGNARIHRQQTEEGLRFRYEQLSEGDPLQLGPIVRGMKEDGLLDSAGFATDNDWYARTAAHIYPDALRNLYASLNSQRVGHTADVLVSFRDGYYYGASIFSRFVRIAATHGNAMRASTNAFLMSTHRSFDTHVRADEAQPLLRG